MRKFIIVYLILFGFLCVTADAAEKLNLNNGVANKVNTDSRKVLKDLNLFPDKQKENHLYYFFSFSMPQTTLENIVPLLKKTGAIMVLRGMKNDSLKETMAALQELDGKYGVQVDINPPLFRKLGVDKVPALVYVKGECKTCGNEPPAAFYTVYGDVSLDYALEQISKEDSDADQYLNKLRKDWFGKN